MQFLKVLFIFLCSRSWKCLIRFVHIFSEFQFHHSRACGVVPICIQSVTSIPQQDQLCIIDCFDSKLTEKWQFYDHFRPFFANYIDIFHKTEIQMVILGCLTALNPNWFTSYDTKSKYFHFRFVVILLKKTHLSFLPFRILCHNFCTN